MIDSLDFIPLADDWMYLSPKLSNATLLHQQSCLSRIIRTKCNFKCGVFRQGNSAFITLHLTKPPLFFQVW